MFNEKVIQEFNAPKNVGILHGHNAQGTTTNEVTNEIIRMYLLISDGKVEEAKFKAFGGVECIALCSVTCDLIRGASLEALDTLSAQDFVSRLGELSENARLLLVQIKQTLDVAVADFYKRLAKEQNK